MYKCGHSGFNWVSKEQLCIACNMKYTTHALSKKDIKGRIRKGVNLKERRQTIWPVCIQLATSSLIIESNSRSLVGELEKILTNTFHNREVKSGKKKGKKMRQLGSQWPMEYGVTRRGLVARDQRRCCEARGRAAMDRVWLDAWISHHVNGILPAIALLDESNKMDGYWKSQGGNRNWLKLRQEGV